MIIIKIALIGVGGALLSMAAGQVKKEYSIFILLGVCLILSGYLLADFHGIIDFINDLTSRIEISETYIRILYKLLAISFVSQIASGICQDMGYKSI
ncbi:MAG: stage III sporulation protein AD, partial [Eubacterium sp.]|nr:stage III sporulation protein AD [Eubacterium sp.]